MIIFLDGQSRLLETDPEVQKDEIICEHINATKPTVVAVGA
jgi:hypothetical protein